MVTNATDERVYEFRGLSSDIKPIGSNCLNSNVDYEIKNGSVFLEIDTAKIFILTTVESTSGLTGSWIEL